tara:strand:+ start:1743 stop:2108 length:366 start_codon:yes stop_codon:yes gene_type:complete
MAIKKVRGVTEFKLTCNFSVENTDMIPRFLKSFRHPTASIKNFEDFKLALITDIYALRDFLWVERELEFDDMDLSDLYPQTKYQDSSYHTEVFLLETTRDGYSGVFELLGRVEISNIRLSL